MAPGRSVLVSLAGGLIFGVVDRFAVGLRGLPFPGTAIAGPWLALAFVAGIFTARRWVAAACGVVALLAGMTGYYAYMSVVQGSASSAYLAGEAGRWLPVAVVAGVIFGYAGFSWRWYGNGWRRLIAVGLLAGTLAGEAAAHIGGSFSGYPSFDYETLALSSYYAELVAAVVLPVALVRKWPARAACYCCAVAVSGLALALAPLLRSVLWVF
jgi:hypothetical protein